MAKLNFTFIPSTKTTRSSSLTLADIPQDVKDSVEEVYEALKVNDGRMFVEFPSVGELNQYIIHAKAYCDLRPEGKLYFRRSPSAKQSPKNPDGLKPNQMEFRITDKTENEQTTEEIREAVDAVKTAAKK